MNLYVAGGVLLVLIGTHIGAFMLGHERATDKCALEQAAADARWQDWYVHAAEEANKRAAQFERDKKRVDSSLEALRREIASAPAADCRLNESDVLLWNRILCAGAAPGACQLDGAPGPAGAAAKRPVEGRAGQPDAQHRDRREDAHPAGRAD